MASSPQPPPPTGPILHFKKEAETELRGAEYVTYSETHALAQRRSEVMYGLKESELRRIERIIQDIKPEPKAFRTWWSLLIGIAATSGFSLLGFRLVQQVPQYMWDIGLVTFFVTLILGFVFLVLDLKEPNKILRSQHDVLDELDFVRSQFEYVDFRPQTAPGSPEERNRK